MEVDFRALEEDFNVKCIHVMHKEGRSGGTVAHSSVMLASSLSSLSPL